ncbi:MAG: hypothetical protein IKC63_00270 [Clostridia bacterium]|nr:hypothetical protein [Clostridia bacterium]
MKKLLSLLILVSMLFTFSSCNAYSDEEAAKIIDELLIREADLNGYIYFDSFKTKEDPGDDIYEDFQKYYVVAPDSKYLTLASLMGEVDAVFATMAREEIYNYAFYGYESESISFPSRFFEDEEGLKIDVTNQEFKGRTVALLGSAKVKRSNATRIRAEVMTYRIDSEGNPREHIKTVELIKENGVWKLYAQTMIAATTDTPLL